MQELVATASTPLVSVVIPCYKQAHFLADAIDSALAQTYPAVEVVVVDDGSPDNTAEVARRYRTIRCIKQENRGLAAARNAGLAASTGEFIVFLDADDRLLPKAVETGVALLVGDQRLGFVAGRSRFIAADGSPLPTTQPLRRPDDPYRELLRRNSILMPGMAMFRRFSLDALGGFAPRIDACADYELYLRISRSFPVLFHDEVVAEYRRHGANMSGDAVLMLRQIYQLMRAEKRRVRGRACRRAHRIGSRDIRAFYGDRVVDQIRLRVRRREDWSGVVRAMITLIQCHPRGVAQHAWRKTILALRTRFGKPAPVKELDAELSSEIVYER